MKAAAKILGAAIGPDKPNARTLGEYLYKSRRADLVDSVWTPKTHAHAETVRSRPTFEKNRNTYEFYPTRDMIGAEFAALWAAQAAHHPGLTEAIRAEIEDVVFFQRPLRPVDPGPCTLDEEEDLAKRDRRAPLALPIQQDFRILQELANLELFRRDNPTIRKRLTMAQRDRLHEALKRSEKVSFDRMYRLLDLEKIWDFNLRSEKRKDLKGDIVSVRLAKETAFGPRWFDGMREQEGDQIVAKLLDEESESEIHRIAVEIWGLPPDAAETVSATPLPDGYGSLGLKALRRIVPILKGQADKKDGSPIRYSDAVQLAGYKHHSDFRDGVLLPELPYYGEALKRYTAPVTNAAASAVEREHGRLANPTVHIGLGQLRKTVNALIEKYGPPEEIVVELTRDLKRSQEEREEVQKRQAENQKRNDFRREEIEALRSAKPGWKPPRDAMLRLRLWEELDADNAVNRCCVYSGKTISRKMLFSDEVEIEHILPFAISLDDSAANLTLSLRQANRDKGNRTPYDAFHTSPGRYDWKAIMLRVNALPRSKQWRFREDAMALVKDRVSREKAKFGGELPKEALDAIDDAGSFLARQLIDTAYLSRLTRQYLWQICDANKTWVIPGQMTAMLRRKWGLNGLLGDHNRKNRADHRHHAIDAYVTGLTDRSMLQEIQKVSGESRERIIDDMPDPWEGYREELKAALTRIVVSHRPDHGVDPQRTSDGRKRPSTTSGRLHEETAYGLVADPKAEGGNVAARKPIDALSENEIDRVRDPELRRKLKKALAPYLADEGALETAKKQLADARKAKDAKAVERAHSALDALRRADKARKKAGAKDMKAALAEYGRKHGIRRVRLVKPEASIVVIRDKSGRPYKAYSAGDNLRVEIFERPDGSLGREIVTAYDANRPDFTASWQGSTPKPRLRWLIHKNDLVKLDGEEGPMRVVSIWERYLQLAGHQETNLANRYRDGEFKWTFANYDRLKELNFRKVTVGPLGDLRDPAKHP